ncbi:hypothetical protein NC651_030725 [Populus alba x Populus x berolinensis]|nr:hypothetical protein NC651_030725 [Populus alba x Populus x berolinensis]
MDLRLPSFENCSRDHNLEAFMRKGRVYLDYRNNQWIFVSQASRIVYIPGFSFIYTVFCSQKTVFVSSHFQISVLRLSWDRFLPCQSNPVFLKAICTRISWKGFILLVEQCSCLLRIADRDGD